MRWLAVIIGAGLTILVAIAAIAAPAAAANHKILVLPVDGTADAAIRAKLTADVARLARSLDGQVATGSATFADTALAVGCDPRTPRCSDEVMATLGVDELVWGTATRDGGQIRLVVRRAARGGAIREISTAFAASDAGDRIATGIAPVFAPPTSSPPAAQPARTPAPHAIAAPDRASDPAGPGDDPPGAAVAPAARAAGLDATVAPSLVAAGDRSDRTVGIAVSASGGAGLVLGLALWASYASLQDQVDHHATRTLGDLQDLRALEDTASSRAIAGDLFVVAGLVAGGIGAYYLYRDHRRHAVAVVPAPIAGGVTLTVIGGL